MQLLKYSSLRKWLFRFCLFLPLTLLILLNISIPMMEKSDEEFINRLALGHLDRDSICITYTEWNDANLRYIHSGDTTNPLLVLIHGSPGDLSAFEAYFKDSLLTAQFQLLAFDRPGFGNSTAAVSPQLDKQYDALRTILNQLSYDDLYILGHSYGGAVVWKSYLDSLPGLRHSIIVAGSVDPALEPREWWRPFLDHSLVSWSIPRMLRSSNREIKELYSELLILDRRGGSATGSLSVFQGEEDKLVPPGNADYLGERVDAAEIIWFEGEGHFILWSKEREIADYIIKLL